MSIETAIYTALNPIAPTAPLIVAQSQTAPFIVYTPIAGMWEETLSDGGTGHHERIQIDVWSTNYADAKAKSVSAQAALRAALVIGQVSENPDRYESDTLLYCVSFDIIAWG